MRNQKGFTLIELIVVITEGIPVHDSVEFISAARGSATRIIGPNCPGLISPGKSNAGIIPAHIDNHRSIRHIENSVQVYR